MNARAKEDFLQNDRRLAIADRDARSRASGLTCSDPSRAVQSQKDDADINVLVKRFGVTGQLPSAVRLPQYGDFEGIADFHDAVLAVRAAEGEFLKIPAEIRRRFDNDPQQWLEFVTNPGNRPQLEEWGLIRADAIQRQQDNPPGQAAQGGSGGPENVGGTP